MLMHALALPDFPAALPGARHHSHACANNRHVAAHRQCHPTACAGTPQRATACPHSMATQPGMCTTTGLHGSERWLELRYVHTVRDLTFPIGDVAVGIGSHSLAGESPKGRFSPREAPSAAAARCSPEVKSAIRCRAAPSRPSRTPCEVGPTTARHRRCPFSPSGQGVETCRSAS